MLQMRILESGCHSKAVLLTRNNEGRRIGSAGNTARGIGNKRLAAHQRCRHSTKIFPYVCMPAFEPTLSIVNCRRYLHILHNQITDCLHPSCLPLLHARGRASCNAAEHGRGEKSVAGEVATGHRSRDASRCAASREQIRRRKVHSHHNACLTVDDEAALSVEQRARDLTPLSGGARAGQPARHVRTCPRPRCACMLRPRRKSPPARMQAVRALPLGPR